MPPEVSPSMSRVTVDGSEIRLYNQLRLVVDPIICRVIYIYISQVVGLGISEPSTVSNVIFQDLTRKRGCKWYGILFGMLRLPSDTSNLWFSLGSSTKDVTVNGEGEHQFCKDINSGQIIATSHDLSTNGRLVRELLLFQGT